MSQDAREQARHKASVMIAFAEGKEIQLSEKNLEVWEDWKSPSWDWENCDYRVKPEERKPREIYIWMHPNGGLSNHDPLVMGWTGPFLFREVLPETETE